MSATLSNTELANEFIPLCIPVLGGNEWEYLKDCIDTGWVSYLGSYVDRFEKQFADYVGSAHAVATNSGTSALHVGLLLAGLKPGEEVIVPSLTFVATTNAVLYCGGVPVFIDVCSNDWNLDVDKLSRFLKEECAYRNGQLYNNESGNRVRAILPVHLYGQPAQIDAIVSLAAQYGLKVVEDAAESLGARWKEKQIGSFGDCGCFSFNGNKLITSGGGGMIVMDDEDLANRARYLTTQARDDGLEYYHEEVGYNYRMTNIQAAVGVAQFEQIDHFLALKRQNADLYRALLADVDGVQFYPQSSGSGSCWMYSILVSNAEHRDHLLSEFQKRNIQARPLFMPIHTLPPYKAYQTYHIDTAIDLHCRGLSLPCSVNLEHEQLVRVVDAIKCILSQN